jgi:hypothetical protein
MKEGFINATAGSPKPSLQLVYALASSRFDIAIANTIRTDFAPNSFWIWNDVNLVKIWRFI